MNDGSTMDPRARALIDGLGLAPHPEGGHYREVYRSPAGVQPDDGRPRRSALTNIFFLLEGGAHSRWHRVRSDEVWHFYGGDPLALFVGSPLMGAVERMTLSSIGGPGRLVHVVPAGRWQAARSLGAYSLVGCTVAPGFEFEDFSFLRDDPEALANLQRLDPALHALI